MTSSGLSNALAICRKEVDQCRRVCSESSAAAAMIVMASASEVSINKGIWLIGIRLHMPPMAGDCSKYKLSQFGNMSMQYCAHVLSYSFLTLVLLHSR
jgi:hypothetical protein